MDLMSTERYQLDELHQMKTLTDDISFTRFENITIWRQCSSTTKPY
jgi:hypothetical protein